MGLATGARIFGCHHRKKRIVLGLQAIDELETVRRNEWQDPSLYKGIAKEHKPADAKGEFWQEFYLLSNASARMFGAFFFWSPFLSVSHARTLFIWLYRKPYFSCYFLFYNNCLGRGLGHCFGFPFSILYF